MNSSRSQGRYHIAWIENEVCTRYVKLQVSYFESLFENSTALGAFFVAHLTGHLFSYGVQTWNNS